MRLDKWLWAARFFKTRQLSKDAVEGGKVHINGQRPKVSKKIQAGELISIRQGFDEKTVTVIALSEKRGPASEAQGLYKESEQSLNNRAKAHELRKLMPHHAPKQGRPNKKERRQIIRFKNIKESDAS